MVRVGDGNYFKIDCRISTYFTPLYDLDEDWMDEYEDAAIDMEPDTEPEAEPGPETTVEQLVKAVDDTAVIEPELSKLTDKFADMPPLGAQTSPTSVLMGDWRDAERKQAVMSPLKPKLRSMEQVRSLKHMNSDW